MIAQSLFKILRMRWPELAIDVLAPSWSKPLLEHIPEVRQALELPLVHGQLGLTMRRITAKSLRRMNYQRAIILPNSFKSALIPWLAGIPLRTGYRGEQRFGLINDMRYLDKHWLPTTIQRLVALGMEKRARPALEHCPSPTLRADRQQALQAVRRLGLNLERPVLALCPGAEYGPAKRWPPAHFAAVARHFRALGYQVWVFGSERDKVVADEVCYETGSECFNLAGCTRLGEAIDLLFMTTAVVSNDSGLMHIAAALSLPLVAVYGSSDPGFTPPLSKCAQIERLDLACSPCFQRKCPLGHLRCLRDLHPDRVIRSLSKLLDRSHEII